MPSVKENLEAVRATIIDQNIMLRGGDSEPTYEQLQSDTTLDPEYTPLTEAEILALPIPDECPF